MKRYKYNVLIEVPNGHKFGYNIEADSLESALNYISTLRNKYITRAYYKEEIKDGQTF